MKANQTIGEPSLHDWKYEEFSQKEDARDEALEYYEKVFKADLCVDFRAGRFEKVDSVMADVLEAIFNDVSKTEQLYRALFMSCINANSDSHELADQINGEMEKMIEKEFEKSAKECDE